uniref:Alkylglycerone-phosphate synthase n=1 Tax=Strigamia maritima TaxID=126957 RepID=T1INM4_STRMM
MMNEGIKNEEAEIYQHVNMNTTSESKLELVNIKPRSTIPKRRQDVLKWDGWGYKDSGFGVQEVPNSKTGGEAYFSGDSVLEFEDVRVDLPQAMANCGGSSQLAKIMKNRKMTLLIFDGKSTSVRWEQVARLRPKVDAIPVNQKVGTK